MKKSKKNKKENNIFKNQERSIKKEMSLKRSEKS